MIIYKHNMPLWCTQTEMLRANDPEDDLYVMCATWLHDKQNVIVSRSPSLLSQLFSTKRVL